MKQHTISFPGDQWETIEDSQELGRTERRLHPYDLLVLGDVATNLWHYEQAVEALKQTDVRPALAEAYSPREESGRQSQALATWKLAYLDV